MKDFIRKVFYDLNEIKRDIGTAKPDDIKIICRMLAKAEMELQAARSLMEARLFEADIFNMQEEQATSDGSGVK